jgi:hypothetical protein
MLPTVQDFLDEDRPISPYMDAPICQPFFRASHGDEHYGHLAPSHVAGAIRAALPKFGPVLNGGNVTDLRSTTHAGSKSRTAIAASRAAFR